MAWFFSILMAQLNEKAVAETPLEEVTEAALRVQGRGCNRGGSCVRGRILSVLRHPSAASKTNGLVPRP
jgi:hypothetical protein